MFISEELAITEEHTNVVRDALKCLADSLGTTTHDIAVRVYLVRGRRTERWHQFENIAHQDPQPFRDVMTIYSFQVMRALALGKRPPGFSNIDLFGWHRTACTISGVPIHLQVEVFGPPSRTATKLAEDAAGKIADELH